MFAGEAFRQVMAEKGMLKVLDLCAAPGGKSTHLSSLLNKGSFMVANEVIRTRAAVLAENVSKWGLGNTLVTQNDPSVFASLEGFFDVILVDAPCSGEGMFRDETAVREWSPEKAQMCSERQRRILMDVWPALKKDGIMIYSTCTFNPAENEQNISWLVRNKEAESVALDISNFEGITRLYFEGTVSYAFYPGKIRGEGFFLSVIHKKDGDEFRYNTRKHNKSRLPHADEKLRVMLKNCDEDLFLYTDRVLSPACGVIDYEVLSSSLNIIKSGTMLGELIHGTFIPSHDLAMSANINLDQWRVYNASWDESIDFLRMADFIPKETEQGRLLICYRGVPLGFVNHLGKRANNGYPQAWRIRMEKRNNFEEVL